MKAIWTLLIMLYTLCKLAYRRARAPIRLSHMLLTGSRAYGDPNPGSDWDFVILMSPLRAKLLSYISDNPDGAVYFGDVNFIIVTEYDRFEAWQRVTCKLIDRRRLEGPITRAEAIKAFNAAGVTGPAARISGKPARQMITPK